MPVCMRQAIVLCEIFGGSGLSAVICKKFSLLDTNDESVSVLSQETDDRWTGESAVKHQSGCAARVCEKAHDRLDDEQVLRIFFNRILQYLEVQRHRTSAVRLPCEHENLSLVSKVREIDGNDVGSCNEREPRKESGKYTGDASVPQKPPHLGLRGGPSQRCAARIGPSARDILCHKRIEAKEEQPRYF